ncbi:hypothetical protein C1Y08_16420 [Pseudomonas sp. FW306-02-F02-AA]|uniref:hypothetical protein n=1 Tax=Pseudomonas TaxID=286 RepID=UPI000B08BCA3|nr:MULTISPECIES: hypothetical protein [Pseudomonas]PMZ02331.1 hypothetical protein C1Y07_20365 [Pseudomonas sp. FW306-02-F02-AB]PMZ09076.1 hypothetical protein C1Y06_15670 [Pseudomonas sp. FW306-02-H06C]PMZ14788.1 hypothetical protein C1Y08_16420 [Pseudomonas sp. FW306-02-F02-AA]PMZ19494.1 hypothetical protein C1Y09_23705 [Pseudomonas sp. FW306-02-F08-AA]PMZ26372.1 hypothetical protein C1Y05_18290 [Pseudomonas sp. FW306-02-F04-BA]
MTEHTGHIKNPLTVISRFAAIAEISGTVVLPFISPENQATYIWFLMLFPALLVGTFFLTLNFNHKTLYAPSDYQNQNHFLNLFGIVTPSEREEKLEEEIIEATLPAQSTVPGTTGVDELVNAINNTSPTVEISSQTLEKTRTSSSTENNGTQTEISKPSSNSENTTPDAEDEFQTKFDLQEFSKKTKLESKLRLKEIEHLSIRKLKHATNIEFSPNVKFDIPGLISPLIFDAVGEKNDTIHIAEIKYFDKSQFSVERFNKTLMDANIAAQNIYSLSDRKVTLHLIVVSNIALSPTAINNIEAALKNSARRFKYSVEVYFISENKLRDQGIPSDWTWKAPAH